MAISATTIPTNPRPGDLARRGDLAAAISLLNGVTNLDMTYDALGRITQRTDVASNATWTYHASKKHAVTQAGNSSFTYTYDANGNAVTRNGRAISWNKYNYPLEINNTATEKVTHSYNSADQRWKAVYVNGATTETTLYLGGLLEKVTVGSAIDYRHYIYAHTNTAAVAVMSRKSSGVNATHYVLDDHQQSPSTLRDASGNLVVNESFTAYGTRRNWSTWSGSANSTELTTSQGITRQGYTWQTALGNMGLNHMNGRVQDTITGIFLSADPYISEPTNTQNYNRYSYVYNNPLSLIDPSGFDACDWMNGYTTAGGTGSGIVGGNNIEQSMYGGTLDMGVPDGKGGTLPYNFTTGSYWMPGAPITGPAEFGPQVGDQLAEVINKATRGSWVYKVFPRGDSMNNVMSSVSAGEVGGGTPQTDKQYPTEAPLQDIGDLLSWIGHKLTDCSPGLICGTFPMWGTPQGGATTVIGKVADLKNLAAGERSLLSRLPNLGSPKANWAQNSSVLRQEMSIGQPIRDATVNSAGQLINNTGFLRAERNLLENHGWTYNGSTTMWYPPVVP